MTKSDTPRTDAALTSQLEVGSSQWKWWVHADFARQLERELLMLKRHSEWLERKFLPCPDCRDKTKEGVCLRCENQRLERELNEANEKLTSTITIANRISSIDARRIRAETDRDLWKSCAEALAECLQRIMPKKTAEIIALTHFIELKGSK